MAFSSFPLSLLPMLLIWSHILHTQK